MNHYHLASRHILGAVGQSFADLVNGADAEVKVVHPTGGRFRLKQLMDSMHRFLDEFVD